MTTGTPRASRAAGGAPPRVGRPHPTPSLPSRPRPRPRSRRSSPPSAAASTSAPPSRPLRRRARVPPRALSQVRRTARSAPSPRAIARRTSCPLPRPRRLARRATRTARPSSPRSLGTRRSRIRRRRGRRRGSSRPCRRPTSSSSAATSRRSARSRSRPPSSSGSMSSTRASRSSSSRTRRSRRSTRTRTAPSPSSSPSGRHRSTSSSTMSCRSRSGTAPTTVSPSSGRCPKRSRRTRRSRSSRRSPRSGSTTTPTSSRCSTAPRTSTTSASRSGTTCSCARRRTRPWATSRRACTGRTSSRRRARPSPRTASTRPAPRRSSSRRTSRRTGSSRATTARPRPTRRPRPRRAAAAVSRAARAARAAQAAAAAAGAATTGARRRAARRTAAARRPPAAAAAAAAGAATSRAATRARRTPCRSWASTTTVGAAATRRSSRATAATTFATTRPFAAAAAATRTAQVPPRPAASPAGPRGTPSAAAGSPGVRASSSSTASSSRTMATATSSARPSTSRAAAGPTAPRASAARTPAASAAPSRTAPRGTSSRASSAEARTGAVPHDPAAPSFSLNTKGVVSPLTLSTWEEQYGMLPAHLKRRYAVVLDGIKEGFRIGVDPSLALARTTLVDPKERYDADTRRAIIEYLDGEKEAGRIVGPLSKEQVERRLGFFQTSPFKLVDKPGSNKKRFVRDLSAPHGSDTRPSVNEYIRRGSASSPPYRTTWHVFPSIARRVLALPKTARVHVADVSSAFRIIPIHPNDQRFTVMNLDDSFYVDLCLPMGLSTATDIFGGVMDFYSDRLIVDWASSGADAFNWVDDLCVALERPLPPRPARELVQRTELSAPTSSASTSGGDLAPLSRWSDTNDQIEARYRRFGLPLAPEKLRPIVEDNPAFEFLGFGWNVELKTVTLLEPKRRKFLDRLLALDTATLNLSLAEVESITGSMAHLCYLIREGKFRLRALFAFAASFGGNYSIRRHPSNRVVRERSDDPYAGVRGELRWWRERLEQGPVEGKLVERKTDLDVEILSDACDDGIGVLVDGLAQLWPLRSGWKGVGDMNIDFAEAMGVELALLATKQSLEDGAMRNVNIIAFCDNGGVVDGWAARSHANPAVARVLLRLAALELELDSTIELLYIPSSANDADAISRGDLSGARGRIEVDLTARWETAASLAAVLA